MRKTRNDKIFYGLRNTDSAPFKETLIYDSKSERLKASKERGADFSYRTGTAKDFLQSWRTKYEHDAIINQLRDYNVID